MDYIIPCPGLAEWIISATLEDGGRGAVSAGLYERAPANYGRTHPHGNHIIY